jgi:hypothetical protein
MKSIKLNLILMIFLAMVFVMASCQPMPNEQIVISKHDGQVSGNPAQSNVSSVPNATDAEPKIIIDEYSQNNLTVKINANVIVPDTDKMPVINVDQSTLNQDMINRFIQACVGDAKITGTDRVNIHTKDELESMIVQAKQQLADWQNYNNLSKDQQNQMDDGTPPDMHVAQLQAIISEDEKEYQNAPSVHDTSSARYDPQKGYLSLLADTGLNLPSKFEFTNGNQSMKYYKYGNGLYPGLYINSIEKQNIAKNRLTISEKDAEKAALVVLKNCNITDVKMAYMVPAISNDGYVPYYAFFFEKMANGVPISSTINVMPYVNSDADTAIPTPPLIQPIQQPSILVEVNNNGEIVELSVESDISLKDTVNENAKLLDLDQILNLFKKDVMLMRWSSQADLKMTFNINTIRLSLMLVRQKDSPDELMLLPVWDFIGTETWHYSDGNESTTSFSNASFLTLNAVDGSVIDRNLGY